MKMNIKEYYKSKFFKPIMPSKTNKRHFRVRTKDNNWVRIPRKIRNEEELKKWIIKNEGEDIYYSCSLWSNPEKTRSENYLLKKPISNNYLIKNDLLFDIDCEELSIKDLDKARMVTNNIYEAMKHLTNYEFQYCSFTGKKGFRLSYEDKNPLPKNPLLRISHLRNERSKLVENIKCFIKNKLFHKDPKYYFVDTVFDEEVSINPFCVVRVLGTVHSTTKFISNKINTLDITRPIEEILKNIDSIESSSFRIPQQREMTQKAPGKGNPRSRLSKPAVEFLKDNSTATPLYEEYFYTNKVLGTKGCYIPFLVYQSKQKYLQEVKRLQKKYSLGTLNVLVKKNKLYVVSIKTMQYEQLKKLLLDSSCINKNSFIKYKRSRIPINAVKKEIIKGEIKGGVSKAHSKIFLQENEELSGINELEITKAKK